MSLVLASALRPAGPTTPPPTSASPPTAAAAIAGQQQQLQRRHRPLNGLAGPLAGLPEGGAMAAACDRLATGTQCVTGKTVSAPTPAVAATGSAVDEAVGVAAATTDNGLSGSQHATPPQAAAGDCKQRLLSELALDAAEVRRLVQLSDRAAVKTQLTDLYSGLGILACQASEAVVLPAATAEASSPQK